MQPRIGVTPNQQRTFGGTNSRPSSASNLRGISAVGSRVSNFHPSMQRTASATAGTTGVSSSPPRMQDALVTNLKQQVACLETEVKYLKEKLIKEDEQRREGGGSRPLTGRSMGSVASSHFSGSANEALSRRAEELEGEVDMLRVRYAEREQQHALEIASIRAGEGISGLSVAHGAAGKFKNEMERREQQNKQEMATMQGLHAQEVVMLQKTVERLQRELQYNVGGGGGGIGGGGGSMLSITSYHESVMPAATRKTLTEELVAFKDQLRAMTDENICLKRQYDDMIDALSIEQQQRRALEASNVDLKKLNESLAGDIKAKLESKIEGLETKARQAHASEVTKHYEMERAKAAETKLKDDLNGAIRDKLEAEEKLNKISEEKTVADSKLATLQETLTDATGERDYYRLQHDRLLTEHKMADTKTKQLEAKVEADRHSIQLLEKQYCGTLDEIDTMRRQHVANEDSYRELDNNDNTTRRQNYTLKQECERLKQKLNVLEEDNQFMQKRYDSVRHLADQSAAEGQIRGALTRLGKTKEELQNLLQTQMRLANELSSAMCDIPDLATVAGAIHHSDHVNHSNPAGTPTSPSTKAAVEHNKDAISKIQQELSKVTNKIHAEEVRLAPLLSTVTLGGPSSSSNYPPMPSQSPAASDKDETKLLGTPPSTNTQQQQPLQQPTSFYAHYPPSAYNYPPQQQQQQQPQQQPAGAITSLLSSSEQPPPSYPLYSSALPLHQIAPPAAGISQQGATNSPLPTSRTATASESRVYSANSGA